MTSFTRRFGGIVLCFLGYLTICAIAQNNPTAVPEQKKHLVIAARMLLDGRGHVLHDTRIVVEGSRIVAVDPKAAPIDYDLRVFTVLPGWIDSHVRLTMSRSGMRSRKESCQVRAYSQPFSRSKVRGRKRARPMRFVLSCANKK